MKRIADTGLIVALLFRKDPFHSWALRAFRENAPFLTCEAVLAEAASFCPDPLAILSLMERGDLRIDPDFCFADEAVRIAGLASKYRDQPMELADACLVRMTEITPDSSIWTIDRRDFTVYRRFGRKQVPCEFPPQRAA